MYIDVEGEVAAEPDELYDRFDLEVRSMQVILAPADSPWRSLDEGADPGYHVVYPFGLHFELRRCVLPPRSLAISYAFIAQFNQLCAAAAAKKQEDKWKLSVSINASYYVFADLHMRFGA